MKETPEREELMDRMGPTVPAAEKDPLVTQDGVEDQENLENL
jgi:hypothetical protein